MVSSLSSFSYNPGQFYIYFLSFLSPLLSPEWVKIFTPNVLKLIGPLVGTEVKNSLPDKIQEKKLHPRIYSIVENLDIDIYVLNLTYRLVSRLQEKNIVIDTLTQFACFCIASLYYDFEIPFALISDVCN